MTHHPPRRTRRAGEITVLVVDDDAMMRTLVGRTLRGEGYQVWTASCAAEARQVLARVGGPLDLILTDVAMPGGMGTQLAEDVRRAHPRVRVLYMSNYTRKDLQGHGIDLGREELLAKPFMPNQLIERVQGMLG
jgi:DNA-binding response OmpR family regulator